ncbi:MULTISPECIES: hypothetical protein [unclassified Mesorhizobium]|nr:MULTISPECIES: hypothetical protein [unclassified Mesorhizobium]
MNSEMIEIWTGILGLAYLAAQAFISRCSVPGSTSEQGTVMPGRIRTG